MSEKDRFSKTVSFQRTFSQQDFDRFARLSGDDNPIHVDPEFSARTRFGRTVAHGMLLYSAVCAGLGGRMPGPGTLQLEQELMFPTPTYTGETVIVCLEPVAQPAPDQMELNVSIIRPAGEIGLQGRTRVCTPGRAGVPLPSDLLPAVRAASTLVDSAAAHRGLTLRQFVETQRAYTPADLDEYAALTGDANPLFGDDAFARSLGYRGRLVPGGLLGGLFSFLLGTRLPGRGANWLKQRLVFLQPAYANQAITARVTVTRLRPEKELVNLRTTCTNPAGDLVCDGEALVFVKDLEG